MAIKTTIFLSRLRHHPFFIKLFNWEYWPIQVANFPVLLMVLWLGLRARDFLFFTAVNPKIETGGMFGESKMNILDQIPKKYLPKTIFISKNTSLEETISLVAANAIQYPLITKPNVGERGMLVSKIENEEQLKAYYNKNRLDFLIQEFIDLPIELAVMHHRFPGETKGKITSICIKETLTVIGNGVTTVRELMAAKPRSILQLPRFERLFPDLLEVIPKKGEKFLLEPIGNHSRGTTFLDGNKFISPKMGEIFDSISNQMEGIHYGRFDMKCASPESVENGDFKVLEYNGVAAEPAHVYDPSIPVWKKYRDIYKHWKIAYEIYLKQKELGVKSDRFSELKQAWRHYSDYMNKHA